MHPDSAHSSTNTRLSGSLKLLQGPSPLAEQTTAADSRLWVLAEYAVLKSTSRPRRRTLRRSPEGYVFTCRNCVIPHDESEYLRRCGPCNRRMLQWRRRKKWRKAILRAKAEAPKGMRRVFLLTLTERHKPVPRYDGRHWRVVPYLQPSERRECAERTASLKERGLAMMRCASFKRHTGGLLWGLESTTRPDSICNPVAWLPVREPSPGTQASPDGSAPAVKMGWESELVWRHHPHFHVIMVGRRWDLAELDALAARYGLRTNIEEVRGGRGHAASIAKAVNYVTKYATKEAARGARAHGTRGWVKEAAAALEQERAALHADEEQ